MLLGICAMHGLSYLPVALLCALAACVAAVVWIFGNGRQLLIGACLFGFAWSAWHANAAMHDRSAFTVDPIDHEIAGCVLDLPRHQDRSTSFLFTITQAAQTQELLGKTVRLRWFSSEAVNLYAGSCWRFSARLKRPRGLLNFNGLDAELSAIHQGIDGSGYVREVQEQLADKNTLNRLRTQLSKHIDTIAPNPGKRFVKALVIGDTRDMTDSDWNLLRASGLTHLFAISGFHVGMMALAGVLIARIIYFACPGLGLRLPRVQAQSLIALAFAVVYAALAGFSLPTVRSLIMIAVVLLTILSRRRSSGLQILSLALIAVLLADPLSVLAPGFWLSFGGVACLIWMMPRAGLSSMLWQWLKAQWIILLLLGPLTLWFFAELSLLSPLINLIVIPIVTLIVIPLSMLGLCVSTLSASAAALIWAASGAIMQSVMSALNILADYVALSLHGSPTSLGLVLCALAASTVLLLPVQRAHKALLPLLFLPLIWPADQRPVHSEFDVEILDVGQGLAVVVRTREHTLVYDAGAAVHQGFDAGRAVVIPALLADGERVTRLIISHDDNDHAGGMQAVRERFDGALVLAAPESKLIRDAVCNDSTQWQHDGVSFRFLHPALFFPYMGNDSSCVLRISSTAGSVLIPGDIGRAVEARLVRQNRHGLVSDLVLVPHHGSAGSSSPEFIDAVSPRWAVATAGHSNRFGHPRADVRERWQAGGADWLETAQSGGLSLSFKADRAPTLRSARQQRARWWREPPGRD